MTTLADVRRMFEPGSRWAVTNHYITREDHPAYGTTERTVTRTTSGKVYLAYADGSTAGIDWPKATQVAVVAETVTFSSHPRMPGEPFLTFRKVDSATPTP